MMFERSGAYSRQRFVEEIRCAAHRNPFPCERCRSRWRREARIIKAVAWFVGVCVFGFVAGAFADDEALSRVRWIAEGVIRREMNPRERVIARSRVMGSDQEECPSLRDLAAEFGVTPECIRLIEMKARAKIMHALTKAGVGA